MSNKKEPRLSELLDAFLEQMEQINKSIEQLKVLKNQFSRINFNLSNIKISPDISNLYELLKENNINLLKHFNNHIADLEAERKLFIKAKTNQSSFIVIAILISCLTTLLVLFIYRKIEDKKDLSIREIEAYFQENPSKLKEYYTWKNQQLTKNDSITE